MRFLKILLIFCFFNILYLLNVDASSNQYSFLDTTTSRPSTVPSSFVIGYGSATASGNSSVVYYNDASGNPVRFEPYFKVMKSTQSSVYCLEGNVDNVKIGNTFTYKGLINDPGIVYIVRNTNGKTTDTKDSYTIGQFATWFYMHEVWGSKYSSLKSPRYIAKTSAYVEPYISLMKRAASISDSAKEIHNNYKEPSIGNLQISDTKMVPKDNYLISNEITVPLTNIAEYKVTVDNGVVISSDGSQKNSFKSGEKFRVKVNDIKNVEINVTVEVEYTKEYATAFRDLSISDSQDVLGPYIVEVKEKNKKNIKLNYTIENVVEISKIDATTGKELPGATLIIRDSNNKEVDKWISTNEIHKVKLNPGTYTLEETIAPSGYILSKEKVTFTVKEDGSCDKVVMKNDPVKSFEISKIDATTGKELPGATLIIRDSNNKEVDKWISTNEIHKVKLNPGTYTLEETIAPDGYILSKEKVTFTVKDDGSCDKVVMKNEPNGILISKRGISSSNELPGATLVLMDEKGNIIEEWISGKVPHVIQKLNPGNYLLKEKKAPEGYTLSEKIVKFSVNSDGTTNPKVIIFENAEIEVPITAINQSAFVFILSILFGLLGIGVIYLNKRIS